MDYGIYSGERHPGEHFFESISVVVFEKGQDIHRARHG